MQSVSGMLAQLQGGGGGQDTAQSALALSEMVSGLAAQISGGAQGGAPPMMQAPKEAPPPMAWEPPMEPTMEPPPMDSILAVPQEPLGPLPTVEEFVAQNGLESWVV